MGYQGHVIPVIIAVFVMCWIEKRLHKVVPAMFDLFVTPLVSVFVTGYLTFTIIGPIFVTIENAIINGVQQLITLPFGIGSLIMGGLYSLTVVAGVHHMYTRDRRRTAWPLWKDLLAAAGFRGEHRPGRGCSGSSLKDKESEDEIYGNSFQQCPVLWALRSRLSLV